MGHMAHMTTMDFDACADLNPSNFEPGAAGYAPAGAGSPARNGWHVLMITTLKHMAKQFGYFLAVTGAGLAFLLLLTYVHVRIRPLYSAMPIYATWAALFAAFCIFYRDTLPGKPRYLRFPVIAIVAVVLAAAAFVICFTASIHFHFAIGGK